MSHEYHQQRTTVESLSDPDKFPDWLVGGAKSKTVIADMIRANKASVDALMLQTFDIAFEIALERLAEGISLDVFCREYYKPISPAKFRTWIYRNPKRKAAYLAAKAIGAEAIEDEMIRISDGIRPDGSETPEDVTRSTLRINTRKWLLTIWNRPRYGDKTTIEQTTTTKLDTSGVSTAELRSRLLESLGLDTVDDVMDVSEDPQ